MKKLNFTIVAGLLAAVVGAALVVVYGHNVDRKIAAGRATTTVLVARADVPAGTPVSQLRGYLSTEVVPQAYVQSGALASLANAPQGAVLAAPLAKGAQVAQADFGSQASSAVAAVTPDKGSVALAIQVGITPGVARYVLPGSRVDLFYTTKTPGGDTAGTSNAQVTKLFATGVKVLSVQVYTPPPTTQNGQAQPAPETGDSVIAVLQADPKLAEKIVNATSTGSIYLGLDAAGDTHTTPTGANPLSILQSNR